MYKNTGTLQLFYLSWELEAYDQNMANMDNKALLVKPAELLLSLCVCLSVRPSVTHFTQKVLIG